MRLLENSKRFAVLVFSLCVNHGQRRQHAHLVYILLVKTRPADLDSGPLVEGILPLAEESVEGTALYISRVDNR